MRYLILSDIHSNWEALEAVIDAASGEYDRVLCCGDIVGYGADPNRVIDWVRNNVNVIVRGNHDKACTGNEDLEWFNPVARISAVWTADQLTPANLEYLRRLPKGPMDVEGFQVLHGSPLDEDEYLVNSLDAAQLVGYLETPLYFFGHTHLQGGFAFHHRRIRRLPQVPQHTGCLSLDLDPDAVYLVNPGAVGQPRDGDPRAGYVLYSAEDRAVTFRRVAYDVAAAQEKIRKAGLPELLAARLAVGG